LEINVVMPGKGTIELTDIEIGDWGNYQPVIVGEAPPIDDDVIRVVNDRSFRKSETVKVIEYRPTTSRYIVRGFIQHSNVVGEAYLEAWSILADGGAFENRILSNEVPSNRNVWATGNPPSKIRGTGGWRKFELPFDLKGARPESVTVEVNVVLPGEGTIELRGITVSDVSTSAGFGIANQHDRYSGASAGMLGGLCGTLAGCCAALFCLLYMHLVPRGEGRGLLTRIVVWGIVIGVICLLVGLWSIISGQPFDIWGAFVVIGIGFTLIPPFILRQMHADYKQAEAEQRRIQALDA
jgi:hypothetical protein